MHNRFPLMESL